MSKAWLRGRTAVAAAANHHVEAMEPRVLFATTTLTTGSGDGSLSITVDAYGAFGQAGFGGNAIYDPIGAPGPAATVARSGVYFNNNENFLDESQLGPGSFTATTANAALSEFDVAGFHFTLEQLVFFDNEDGTTTLAQTYTLRNDTGQDLPATLVRHLDADLNFRGTAEDFAFGLAEPITGLALAYQFDDAGAGSTDPTAFVGLFNFGSDQPSHVTVQEAPYFSNIISAFGIPSPDLDVVANDFDLDGFTDAPADYTLSLQEDYSVIPAGDSASFTTLTIFGTDSPQNVLDPDPGDPGTDPGEVDDDFESIPLPLATPEISDLVALPDGRIVVVGNSESGSGNADIVIFRLNADGTLDTTFNNNAGVVQEDLFGDDSRDELVSSLAIQPDGKIVVVGTIVHEYDGDGNPLDADFFAARFTAEGALDPTFNAAGFNLAEFSDDPLFNPTVDQGTGVAVQPDGGIVVVGTTDLLDDVGDFAAARFRADGTDDTAFGPGDGTSRRVFPGPEAEAANAADVQADGKIVIGGEVSDPFAQAGSFLLLRLNTDGTPDGSFGSGGFVSTDLRDSADSITSLDIQRDGKIVAGGYSFSGDILSDAFDSDFALARYNTNGTLDAGFDGDGVVLTSLPGQLAFISKLAIDPGGNIVVVGPTAAGLGGILLGQFGVAAARYKANGSLDPAFSEDGILQFDPADIFGGGGGGGGGGAGLTSGLRAAEARLTVAAAAKSPAGGLAAAANDQPSGAQLLEQQALIALSVQGKLDILVRTESGVRVARVVGDAGAPSATVVLLPAVTSFGQTEATFVIEFTDDLAIDLSTLGAGDIIVTAPNNSTKAAELITVDANNPAAPRATYRYVPDGGAFTTASNGNYALAIGPDQVRDSSGFALTGGPIAGATFTVNVASDGPNLAAGQVTGKKLPPSVVGGGKASGGSVLVTNSGNQDAVGTISITVFASADGLVNAGDATVGTFPAKVKLKPGQGKAMKLGFKTFPANVPDGDYFLLAQVDSGGQLTETNESDNVGSTAATIRIAAPFVDLGFTGPVTGFKSPLTVGKKGRAAVPLRNAGNIPAKTTANGQLFLSADQSRSGDDRLIGTLPIKASLKPGTTKATKVSFTLPGDVPAGSYFLILVLDAPGNDRDPADNVAVSAGQVTVA